MGLEAVDHLTGVPVRAQLEGRHRPVGRQREGGQQPVEAVEVGVLVGEAQQHRAQVLAEGRDRGQEGGHPVLHPVEVAAVGDAHVGLGGEAEPGRHLRPPLLEGGRRRQPAVGGVGLDGREAAAVEVEHPGRRRAVGVEAAEPLGVRPAARPHPAPRPWRPRVRSPQKIEEIRSQARPRKPLCSARAGGGGGGGGGRGRAVGEDDVGLLARLDQLVVEAGQALDLLGGVELGRPLGAGPGWWLPGPPPGPPARRGGGAGRRRPGPGTRPGTARPPGPGRPWPRPPGGARCAGSPRRPSDPPAGAGQLGAAPEHGRLAQVLLDAQQLVVLGHPLRRGPGRRS